MFESLRIGLILGYLESFLGSIISNTLCVAYGVWIFFNTSHNEFSLSKFLLLLSFSTLSTLLLSTLSHFDLGGAHPSVLKVYSWLYTQRSLMMVLIDNIRCHSPIYVGMCKASTLQMYHLSEHSFICFSHYQLPYYNIVFILIKNGEVKECNC